MNRRIKALFAFAVLSGLGMSVSMCGGSDAAKPKSIDGVTQLSIKASPKSVPADGTTSDITITAAAADGTNGSGTVTLQATNGVLGGSGNSASLVLSNGKATTKFSCDKPACVGNQTITASWSDRVETESVEFTAAAPTQDAGPDVDAHVDIPDANIDGQSTADASDGSVDDATVVQGTLTLTASKPKIYAAAGDFSALTAVVKQNDGGPIANEPLTFSTDHGHVVLTDGGSPGPSVNAVTNALGVAIVNLKDNGVNDTGTATANVLRPATLQTAQASVSIVAGYTLTFSAIKCAGAPCSIMGIKGSGFNESAAVTFKVTDASNNPVPGVTVSFTIVSPPTGTTVNATAVTDATGIATATAVSGTDIGIFTVTATVDTAAGPQVVQSTSIGLRGALPTNKGFSFTCSKVNLNAYDSPSPPLNVPNVTCSIKLIDRYGNAVGTGTSVNFKTEAGTLPTNVATQAYTTTVGSAEGTATVAFSTLGNFPAVDVDPFPAAAAQFPAARAAEPSSPAGLLIRNPRDGFVSLLAYVKGEEFLSDDNKDNVHQPSEQFVDQGEPLVDSNDNGVWDQGEFFLDVNSNGNWDGPNGIWESATTVWAEARILYTAAPSAAQSSITPVIGWTIPTGGSQPFTGYFLDMNQNYLSSAAVLVFEPTAARTLTYGVTQGVQDGYGFAYERRLVSAVGEADCTPTTPVCVYKPIFTQWAGTTAASSIVATLNNPAAPTPPGGAATFKMKATQGGTTLILTSTGAVGP